MRASRSAVWWSFRNQPVWLKHPLAPIFGKATAFLLHRLTDTIDELDVREAAATPTTTPRTTPHSPALAIHTRFVAGCRHTTTLKYQPILRLVFFCLLPRVHGGSRGFLRTSPKALAAVFDPVFSLRWPVLSVSAPTKIGQVLKHKI